MSLLERLLSNLPWSTRYVVKRFRPVPISSEIERRPGMRDRRERKTSFFAAIASCAAISAIAVVPKHSGNALALPRFEPHEVATALTGGYQVIAADLNRDGKPDLIALASNLPELVWFENPSWTRHVLASG